MSKKVWAIVVDYYMGDSEGDEWTEKNYLYTMGKFKVYTFHKTTNAKDDLKTFSSEIEAERYIADHNLKESCCYTNCRPEQIDKPMNLHERADMVRAMELICRCINDRDVFDPWLMCGVADGDITGEETDEDLEWYCENENFAELMACFLRRMAGAKRSGGLLCDDIVSAD